MPPSTYATHAEKAAYAKAYRRRNTAKLRQYHREWMAAYRAARRPGPGRAGGRGRTRFMNTKDKIATVLCKADEACESENRHDRYGMAERIYKAVEKYVLNIDRLNVAKAIAKQVVS